MKILISDYKEQMEPDYTLTIDILREILPDATIAIEPYGSTPFYKELHVAEGLITAFIPVDQPLLERAPKLRCISLNSAGFSNLSINALKERGIAACHITEYCTREVSEHAIALMLALNHNLPAYQQDITTNHNWLYQSVPAPKTLNHKTLAIFGFGRIGRMTSALAQGLGMQVIAVDPYVSPEDMKRQNVKWAEPAKAFCTADVIINHMALTPDNYHFFNQTAFRSMTRQPIFINVGRGGCVDEDALLEALNQKYIQAAGLDVLEDENPDLKLCPFVGRPDVILTPHCAFYSEASINKLHQISARNLAYYLTGNYENVEGLLT